MNHHLRRTTTAPIPARRIARLAGRTPPPPGAPPSPTGLPPAAATARLLFALAVVAVLSPLRVAQTQPPPATLLVNPATESGAEPRALQGLPPSARETRDREAIGVRRFTAAFASCLLISSSTGTRELPVTQGLAARPRSLPPNPFDLATPPATRTAIDDLVFAKLEQSGITPAAACSDAVFVRRAYLDVTGTLPTGFEAREFILDRRPDKRRTLIDRLLAQDAYADYWAMKWSDVLRLKAEYPINLWPNAAQAYYRWIHTSVRDNLPYDQFARALLTSSGSNFRVGQVNFYRALQSREPRGIAQAVALTFMGTRTAAWPAGQWDGLAAFFSQVGYKSTAEWKEEIVFHDPDLATNGLWRAAGLPDGTRPRLAVGRDPREVFADWLITPENPWFARNLVNRVWSWLLGRGIVHEPDDIRPDNPPANPELLAFLEREFIAGGYDVKKLCRLILNSRTYQLSSLASGDHPEAAALFAAYPVRRLEAEVLIDALNQITGTSEKYTSPIPEPFTFMPEDQRAVALPDGSITSPFLELFGRSPRDTGLETERNNRTTAAQRLHLLNSTHLQRKLEQSRMIQYQTGSRKTPREIAVGIYLGILSRFPTEDELKTVAAYAGTGQGKGRAAAVDLAWALINSDEFLYRH